MPLDLWVKWSVRLLKPIPGVRYTVFGPYEEGAAHALSDEILSRFPNAEMVVEPMVRTPLAAWANVQNGALM